jgi:hypothetical protein
MVAKVMVRNHDWGGKVEWIERNDPKDAIQAAIGMLDAFRTTNGKVEPIRVFLNWNREQTNYADWAEDVDGRDKLIELLVERGGEFVPSPKQPAPTYPSWGEF